MKAADRKQLSQHQRMSNLPITLDRDTNQPGLTVSYSATCSIVKSWLCHDILMLSQIVPMRGPGCIAQSVGHLTRKSGVLCSIPGLATYFRFSFRFFNKGSCQLLVKVYARSTG